MHTITSKIRHRLSERWVCFLNLIAPVYLLSRDFITNHHFPLIVAILCSVAISLGFTIVVMGLIELWKHIDGDGSIFQQETPRPIKPEAFIKGMGASNMNDARPIVPLLITDDALPVDAMGTNPLEDDPHQHPMVHHLEDPMVPVISSAR